MRLFVALDLDEALRRAASDVSARIRRHFERIAPAARVSWTAADRMHITVHFLGEVTASEAQALTAAFRRPIEVDPFRLEVGAPGVFPASGRPRVLWLGVAAKGAALATIHRVTGERLLQAGVRIDPAPFAPHLTIGRVRTLVGAATAGAALKGVPDRIGTCRVDEVTLYESRLRGPRSSYVALATAPLAGSAR